MRDNNHFIYEPWTEGDQVPMPQCEKIETICPHCNNHYFYRVPSQWMDWEKIAEAYKKTIVSQDNGFNNIIKDMAEMFPEVPIEAFVKGKKSKLLNKLKELLERFSDLTDE